MSKPSIPEVLRLALTAGGLYLGWQAVKAASNAKARIAAAQADYARRLDERIDGQ